MNGDYELTPAGESINQLIHEMGKCCMFECPKAPRKMLLPKMVVEALENVPRVQPQGLTWHYSTVDSP